MSISVPSKNAVPTERVYFMTPENAEKAADNLKKIIRDKFPQGTAEQPVAGVCLKIFVCYVNELYVMCLVPPGILQGMNVTSKPRTSSPVP
jgi:hypothetical protein